MRTYKTDGTIVTRGIDHKTADGIFVGDVLVSFADSLLHMAPNFFRGPFILNCGVEQDADGSITLNGDIGWDDSKEAPALLHINQLLSDDIEPTCSTTGIIRSLVANVAFQRMYTHASMIGDDGDYYWSGLIEMQPGASITIRCESNFTTIKGLRDLLLPFRRKVHNLVQRTTYNYNGVDISVQHENELDGHLIEESAEQPVA